MKPLIPVAISKQGKRIDIVGMPVNLQGLYDMCEFLSNQTNEHFAPSDFMLLNFGSLRSMQYFFRTAKAFDANWEEFRETTGQQVHAMN